MSERTNNSLVEIRGRLRRESGSSYGRSRPSVSASTAHELRYKEIGKGVRANGRLYRALTPWRSRLTFCR